MSTTTPVQMTCGWIIPRSSVCGDRDGASRPCGRAYASTTFRYSPTGDEMTVCPDHARLLERAGWESVKP